MAGNNDVPDATPYGGPLGIARDSIWLTSEDLPHDRDTEVVIEQINMRKGVKWQGGRVSPVVVSAQFKGKSRELRLNATHRKTLRNLFQSSEGRDFVGKRVALYVEQDVRRPDGTTGPAVRIRAKRLPQDGPAPKPAEAPPADPAPTGASAE